VPPDRAGGERDHDDRRRHRRHRDHAGHRPPHADGAPADGESHIGEGWPPLGRSSVSIALAAFLVLAVTAAIAVRQYSHIAERRIGTGGYDLEVGRLT
jgi:hypothetical protein